MIDIRVDESAADIAELWRDFKEGGASDARERLILQYSPLVKFVAGRVAAGLPQNIEQSDLVSYGIFGLIDAINKFDPGRGYKFETYAINRIKGAIIDELRSIDWVPRSVRAKARAIERAFSKLENELRRSPDDKEIAAELGVTENELARRRAQLSAIGVGSLEESLSVIIESDRITPIAGTVPDCGDNPTDVFEAAESREILTDAVDSLPIRERQVVMLYYYEELPLAEIGRRLGVTESRICQIKGAAIVRLQSRLRAPTRVLVS